MEKEKCTGCHACSNVCPKSCISMQTDSEGFLYPEINAALCVHCGKCEQVCPALIGPVRKKVGQAYACINKNDDIRMQSSSGGVFTLIAEHVINNGGTVFGAAFDENLSVRHTGINSIADIEKLRGSKYIQSSIGNTYKEAKKLLESGVPVLFTGTPCQISGLLLYLGKEYDNLFTQDLICHGVPSPMVWQRYVKYREAESGSKTRRMFFRNKKYGWKTYSVQFEFSNCTEYEQILSEDLFMRGFLADLFLRPSCYQCPSKGIERQSDITLADFWGVENVAPEMFDDKGTSLVVVNSDKGKRLFDAISPQMKIKETAIEQTLSFNPAAYKSADLPQARARFMHLINGGTDFETAIRKSINNSIIKRALRKIKKIIRKVV